VNRIETTNNYQERINHVMRYIESNLGEKIDLARLAEIANFSQYHFHRIMRAHLNESIGSYIIRIRMETATTLLFFTEEAVGDIAWKVGYESPAAFSKAFQKRFGTSPSEYRRNREPHINQKDFQPAEGNPDLSTLKIRKMELKPKIKEIQPKKVVYIRAIGDYNNVGPVWERLGTYMQKNRLFGFGTECLAISYDDPDVTDKEKLRYDACFTVSKEVKPEGEVGFMEIEGGWFAIFRHKGPYSTLNQTYRQIYKNWLPESGYGLRDMACMEIYLNDPTKTKAENLKTDIYIGIKK